MNETPVFSAQNTNGLSPQESQRIQGLSDEARTLAAQALIEARGHEGIFNSEAMHLGSSAVRASRTVEPVITLGPVKHVAPDITIKSEDLKPKLTIRSEDL